MFNGWTVVIRRCDREDSRKGTDWGGASREGAVSVVQCEVFVPSAIMFTVQCCSVSSVVQCAVVIERASVTPRASIGSATPPHSALRTASPAPCVRLGLAPLVSISAFSLPQKQPSRRHKVTHDGRGRTIKSN